MNYYLQNIKSFSATAENPEALSGQGGRSNGGRKGSPCIEPLSAGEKRILLHKRGPGIIRKIWCTIPADHPQHLRNIILRMYWDGQACPSVEAPLGDFFGIAHGKRRKMITPYVGMQDARGLNCFIPMPFRKEALITIENDSDTDAAMFFYQIDFTIGDCLDENVGYFHAQFRRENPCAIKKDYVILDGVQGRGVYIGTVLGIRNLYSDHLQEWWGEGEVKFYLDQDEEYPTICGTGLEDYIGSGWGTDETCTPYQGAPLLDQANGLYSLYRFHHFDPVYFQNKIKVTVQQLGSGERKWAEAFYGRQGACYKAAGCEADSHLCLFERSDDYCSVAYWYQELPTNPFPKFPDRKERTIDII